MVMHLFSYVVLKIRFKDEIVEMVRHRLGFEFPGLQQEKVN